MDFGHVPIDKLKTYPTAPLNVEVGGCKVMVHITVIGTGIGAEATHDHMVCPTLTCHNPIWTIWESFLP